MALCLPQSPGLSNRLEKPGEQGEPGILRHLAGTQAAPPAARARAGICAQPGHGTVCHRDSETQGRADSLCQKSLQLTQAGLESADPGKKGNQRGLCCIPSGAPGSGAALAAPSTVGVLWGSQMHVQFEHWLCGTLTGELALHGAARVRCTQSLRATCATVAPSASLSPAQPHTALSRGCSTPHSLFRSTACSWAPCSSLQCCQS